MKVCGTAFIGRNSRCRVTSAFKITFSRRGYGTYGFSLRNCRSSPHPHHQTKKGVRSPWNTRPERRSSLRRVTLSFQTLFDQVAQILAMGSRLHIAAGAGGDPIDGAQIGEGDRLRVGVVCRAVLVV